MTKTVATYVVGIVAGTGLALSLTACGAFPTGDGVIREVEEGRNGVKVEVQRGDDPDTTEEVYLLRDTPCEVEDRLDDCADADDYLVPAANAVPGLNGSGDRDDD